MGRQRIGTAVAILAAVLATATACAQPLEPGPALADPSDFPPEDFWYGEPCTDAPPTMPPPALETEQLAADAGLVRVARCIFDYERVPGDGEWMVRLDQEATTDLDALEEALKLPSEQPGAHQLCTAIGYLQIVLTVTDEDGRQFHPAIPTTACGAPMPIVTDAIVALPWTTVTRTRVGQYRSQLVLTSGCPSNHKAMIALIAAESNVGAERLTLDATPRLLRTCRFVVPGADAVRGDLTVGDLVAATTLEPAAAGELLTAINAAPSTAPPCSTPSSFVVLQDAEGNLLDITVEVEGCYRAMVGSDIRQLDPEVVTRLLG